MKAKILVLILLFTVQQVVKSQSFDKKSSWKEVTTNVMDDTFFEINTYKIDGDTLIGDKSYSKIFRNNKFFSALRETEDNKIYAYFPNFKEYLVYDFDWYLNKTLYCQTSYADNYVQAVLGNSIDSIQLLDGKYYKCVKNHTGEVSLIRGIGNTLGFFILTFSLPTNGDKYALLCFHIDDELIYLNPKYSDCNGTLIDTGIHRIETTDNDSKIKLYSNSSNDIVTVEFLENLTTDAFKIFDIKGSLIRIYEVKGKNKIEIKNLEKGTYLYSAITKNNQNLSGKIIIK